jgi:GT2 family glycosyltransferase
MSTPDHRSDAEHGLRTEVGYLGRIVDEQERTIASLRDELSFPTTAIGRRLRVSMDRLRYRMLGVPVLRQVYRALYRALEIWADEGFTKIFVRTGHKIGLALRGRDFHVEDRKGQPGHRAEAQYERWLRHDGASPEPAAMRATIAGFASMPTVSVLVGLEHPDPERLQRLVQMLQAQAYHRWELCIAVPSAARHAYGAEFAAAAVSEPRLKVSNGPADPPTPGDACVAAGGDFLGVLDADDALAADALFEIVRRINDEPEADIIYSDEDSVTAEGKREEPFFKPDWSPDLLLSTNYLERFGVFRRRLVDQVGGFRADAGRGQVYDLVLRLAEVTDRIAHVPRVLCHRRRHAITVDAVLDRHATSRAECRALEDAFGRRRRAGRAEAMYARSGPRFYAARFDLRERPLVSIIIPTRNKRALLQTTIDSIWQRTDYDRYEIIVIDNDSTDPDTLAYLASLGPRCQVHTWTETFNYSAINNFGARHARGEQLLFLNNDMEVRRADWLSALLEHAQRPEVGAVGARLLYGDGRIQHAGVVVGINRAAANAFRLWPDEVIGRPRLADVTRNCSAVTGACMLVPRRVFDQVGGFNERLRVVLNDVDLCLRIRQHGYLVVYTPHATLNHYEGSSRGLMHPTEDQALFEELWDPLLNQCDPYYNPNLTRTRDDWSLRVDDVQQEDAGRD